MGYGISIVNDEIGDGVVQETFFDGIISYTVETSRFAKLSFGLTVGGNLLNLDFAGLNNFDQEPIAELPLNEKVMRYRTEKRFGYVKVERTGQEGWVENARLKWRLEKQQSESKTAVPQDQQEKPSDQLAPEPSQDKTKTGGVLSPKEAEAATPPEASSPSKSKKKPDASVLDSY